MAVYFIHDPAPDLVKIGFSDEPWSRLTKIQSDCSGALSVLAIIDGDEATERAMHAAFSKYRVRGEWFHRGPGLACFLSSLPRAERPLANEKTRSFWNGKTAAEACRLTGLSKSHISKIQSGGVRPSPENAIKLQRATGVSAIKLVFGDLASEAA